MPRYRGQRRQRKQYITGRSSSKAKSHFGVKLVCPRCGHEWISFATVKYVKCPSCGSFLINPLYEIAEQYLSDELKLKKDEEEALKLIITGKLIPVSLLVKSLGSRSVRETIRYYEKKGVIKVIRFGRKLYLPLSEFKKLVKVSHVTAKRLEKILENKKEEQIPLEIP